MNVGYYSKIDETQGNDVDIFDVLNSIKSGTWKDEILQVREGLLSKENLPVFIPAGTIHGQDKSDINHLEHSGVCCLDIDEGIGDYEKAREILSSDPHCMALFSSASGKGFAFLSKIPPDVKSHKEYYKNLCYYIAKNYGYGGSSSQYNVNRLRYVSYDPQMYINKASEVYQASVPTKTTVTSDLDLSSDQGKYEYAAKARNKRDDYIDGDRNNYIFRLACFLNELGVDKSFAVEKILEDFDLPNEEARKTIYSAYRTSIANSYEVVSVPKEISGIDLDKYKLRLDYQVKHSEPSLYINDFKVLYPGEFGCIVGLPGSGKSSVIEAFIAAFMKSKYDLHSVETLGISFKSGGRKVAFLDTERPPDANRVSLMRIERRLSLSQRRELVTEDGAYIKGFDYLMFAQAQNLKEIKDLLMAVYQSNEYEFVIIDGILDFVTSMNNEEDCKEVITWIRSLGVIYDVTTLMTLHPNKNSENMAGHLGGMIYRFGRAVFIIRNTEADNSIKELSPSFSQGKLTNDSPEKFIPCYFRWSDEARMMVGCGAPAEELFKEDTIKLIFSRSRFGSDDPIPSKKLKERYAEAAGLSFYTAEKHIEAAEKEGYITPVGERKHKGYLLNSKQEIDEPPF